MMPDGILFGGQFFSHRDLVDGKFNKSKLSEFAQEAISFYQSWFAGNEEFEFQTSGTTGRPKKIAFHRKHLIQSAKITIEELGIKKGRQLLLCLHPGFVAGKMMLVRAFVGGLRILAAEPSADPLKDIQTEVHFASFVPNQIVEILKNGNSKTKLGQINNVLVGGGDLSATAAKEIQKMNNDIYQTYGMTETLTHIALKKISGPGATKYYRVLKDFEISLLTNDCLAIKTPYHEDRIETNDLIEIIDKNQFKWMGRADNVINSGGVKIIPEEIEALVQKFFDRFHLKNAFFIAGIHDEKLGQKVILAIEGKIPYSEEELIAELKSALPKYKSPKNVILFPSFEYTNTGKINRPGTMKKHAEH